MFKEGDTTKDVTISKYEFIEYFIYHTSLKKGSCNPVFRSSDSREVCETRTKESCDAGCKWVPMED
jgi:hypothetical protein